MKKKMLSRLISLCMVTAMMLCITPAASAADFSDVPADAWYREAVDYVSDNGLMAGTGNGQFSPNATMSRAMLVAVLYRMDGTPAASGNGGFSDVPANAYYTAAVAWAAENQIVYAAYKNYDTSASTDISRFADAASVSGYAKDAMRGAVGAGIISGSDGRLMPSGSATRAQAAAMLMRFAQGRTNGPSTSALGKPDSDCLLLPRQLCQSRHGCHLRRYCLRREHKDGGGAYPTDCRRRPL